MSRRSTAALALLAAAMAGGPGSAAHAVAAEIPPVALTATEVTMTADDDGHGKATVTAINLGPEPVDLTLALPDRGGCLIEPKTATLPDRQQTDVDFEVTGCQLGNGDAVEVTVTVPGHTWNVAAKVEDKADPPWNRMVWFVWALVAALVLALLVYARWDDADGQPDAKTPAPSAAPTVGGTSAAAAKVPGKRRPNKKRAKKKDKRVLLTPLPGLGEEYDFTKSWASNATIIAGAFAAVFGASDVLKAILGKEDTAIIGLLAVSAAVALGLTAAGPLAVATVKSGGHVTPAGLLAAAVITLTATGGQLGVIVETAARLELGLVDEVAALLGVLGAALPLAYAWTSLSRSLSEGIKPKTAAESTTVKRRKTKTEAKKLTQNPETIAFIDEHYPDDDELVLLTSFGDTPLRRRRSPIL